MATFLPKVMADECYIEGSVMGELVSALYAAVEYGYEVKDILAWMDYDGYMKGLVWGIKPQ